VVTVSLSVRLATLADIEPLLAVREAVAVDLLERGIPWNPNSTGRELIESWIAQGLLWVATSGGRVIGMVAVWWVDPTGHWPAADLAAYVHDLTVDPALKGERVGERLLAWVESYAAGRGRPLVRLDCDAANVRLCRYYDDLGYRWVSTEAGFALFERRF
jgi:ribosomal protein S18 acetylase RimI-like enzyme